MRWRRIGVLTILTAVGVFAAWRIVRTPAPADAAAEASAPPAVPVTTAPVKVQTVPVYMYGLGTVQALNVVEIKAQVNGVLTSIPVKEGQEVHKGDVIAQIDPAPYKAALDQAIAQRQEDQASLQSAQLDLQRYTALAQKQFAPVQQVDDQRATVNKGIATVAADTAMVETAAINLNYCTIHSPIDGRVGLYQTDIGNLIEVASQSGIVSITQDKPISVVFTLPEADLLQVQGALANGTVPVAAFNSRNTSELLANGTLLTPNNTIDTTTGTISLKAEFANEDDHLWPGEFVNMRVQVGTLPNAVTAPLAAVQHGPDGLFAYVVKPDSTVAQVGLQVGYQDDGTVVVTKGLTGNETVVLSGQSRLSPGTRVAATDASKAPPPPPPSTGASSG